MAAALKVCKDVLDDGTPILVPRYVFPYEHKIYDDAPPEAADFEDYYLDYAPEK